MSTALRGPRWEGVMGLRTICATELVQCQSEVHSETLFQKNYQDTPLTHEYNCIN